MNGFIDNKNTMTSMTSSMDNYNRRINYDKNNQFGINLYLLGYDKNKNLTKLNEATIQNLRTYLSSYKMLNDGINLILLT